MENIKVLKLLSGEEIVCDVQESETAFLVKNAVKFVMTPINQSQVGIEMHPFVMLSDDKEMEISKSFVITVCNPVDKVLEAYSSQFSDLVLPPEKSLIT